MRARQKQSAGRVRGERHEVRQGTELEGLVDGGEELGFYSQGDGSHWSILSRSHTI